MEHMELPPTQPHRILTSPVVVAIHPDATPDDDDAIREARARAIGHDIEPFVLGDDSPHEALLARALEVRASLIVLGPGPSGLTVTSLAGRVIRHSHCPVLIARRARVGAVVAGTDFSDPSYPALRTGYLEARRAGVAFVGVHVVGIASSAGMGNPMLGASIDSLGLTREATDDAQRHLEEVLARVAPGAEARVLLGSAAARLMELAESEPTSLLVVGTHGRTGLGRLLIGSTAEALARHAPCSVLVVPMSATGEGNGK